MPVTTDEPQQVKLHRNLSVWGAIGISLALMAPSMAASINPQATAAEDGRAVPLAFAIAFVGVLFVAYTFVRLTQRFHHSGSVYGFVGATLGPRAGVISGWALAGTYTFYAVTTALAAGRFTAGFFDSTGIWTGQPSWTPFLLAAVWLVLIWWLAITPARGSTRLLIAAEAVTVTLIMIVIVIVFAKLAGHAGPGKLGVNWSVFSLPSGVPVSTIFLGVVFGFLSFAGFEAAATLGEETTHPNRDIPRAILGVAVFGGVYYVVVTAVESMGFGTSAGGVKSFVASQSLIGDLGSTYVSSWVGNIITVGATVSALGCALACTVGAARLLFALGRDGMLPASVGKVEARRKTPVAATSGVILISYLIIAFAWFALRTDPFTLFVFTGTIGTLILLVVYVLATIGMVKLVFFSGDTSVRRWELLIPVLGIVVLGYTLLRNVYPFPTGSAWWGPGTAAGWLLVGIIGILVQRGAAVRAGQLLTQAEGLSGTGAQPVAVPVSDAAG